jgi:hypothetical protein
MFVIKREEVKFQMFTKPYESQVKSEFSSINSDLTGLNEDVGNLKEMELLKMLRISAESA